MLQNDFQRITDAANLPPIASDPVEDLSFKVGVACAAEIDVDEAELTALLREGPGIDRLHQLIRRKGNLKGCGHGASWLIWPATHCRRSSPIRPRLALSASIPTLRC